VQSFDDLKRIMDRLRGPGGCPWDREQTVASLRPYLLEECYELLEALEGSDAEAVRGELGDLLFQIVFLSRLYEEQGAFALADVAEAIGRKMVRRHPHVFADKTLETAGEVLRQWGELKAEERGEEKGQRSLIDGVPRALPALQKSWLLGERAAHVGFDWPDAEAVVAKVEEELGELRAAAEADRREEVGDMLFAVAQLARKLGLNPEEALQAANRKFTQRFQAMEARLKQSGRPLGEATAAEMDAAWEAIKKA